MATAGAAPREHLVVPVGPAEVRRGSSTRQRRGLRRSMNHLPPEALTVSAHLYSGGRVAMHPNPAARGASCASPRLNQPLGRQAAALQATSDLRGRRQDRARWLLRLSPPRYNPVDPTALAAAASLPPQKSSKKGVRKASRTRHRGARARQLDRVVAGGEEGRDVQPRGGRQQRRRQRRWRRGKLGLEDPAGRRQHAKTIMMTWSISMTMTTRI